MANTYAAQSTKVLNTTPPVKVPPAAHGGRARVCSDTITWASQAAADTITVLGGTLPVGAQFLYGIVTTDTSTGSTTFSVGTSGTPAKYKALGALTATDTPTLFGKTAAELTPLTAEEQIIVTLAAATAPSSGTMTIQMFYALD